MKLRNKSCNFYLFREFFFELYERARGARHENRSLRSQNLTLEFLQRTQKDLKFYI